MVLSYEMQKQKCGWIVAINSGRRHVYETLNTSMGVTLNGHRKTLSNRGL